MLPVALALYVVEEVAAALVYLHDFDRGDGRPLGLVHRDTTPSNVLVSRSGEVKLADLGIVKATTLAEQTRARIVRGKYAYLSPEQLAGEPLGSQTDQFALGITLAELVTGRRPYDGATAVETMDRIRAGVPTLDGVPEDVREVVARCLQRDPSHRFENTRALLESLHALREAHGFAGATDLASWLSIHSRG